MIQVCRSKIIVKNYQKGDYDKLLKSLSVWDQGTFSYSWCNYLIEGDDLIIPRGMNLKYLYHIYPNKRVVYDNSFDKQKSVIFKSNYEPRDSKQEESINFLLNDDDNKMLCLKTGGGKTFCTIYALSKIKKRSMVIVDNDKTMTQWKDEFVKFTSLSENDIYLISGSDSIEKIVKAKKDLNFRVFIASHRTISSFATKNGWDKIGELFRILQVGNKVYDEAHVEFKNIFMIDVHTNTKTTIYLTATPGRSNHKEDMVYQNMFKTVPKYGLEEKFQNNYHHIYYIGYNSNPTLTEEAKCQNRYGFSVNDFSDYCFSETKYPILLNLVEHFLNLCLKRNEGTKIAILIHKVDHVQKLYDDLTKKFPNKSFGRFCSLVPTKEREKELDADIIISTDKSLGKAVDIKNLQYLMMFVPTSSKIVSEQVLGRLRYIEGKKVVYFDFTDLGFNACVKQRQKRKQLLDKKAVAIKSLDIK